MIVRIFQVTIAEGREAEFEDFFRNTAKPLVESQPGIVSVTAGTPRPETPNQFCMVMVWRDVESLKAFAGDDWRKPHIHPDEVGVVEDRMLHHYELVAA